jgi:cell division protein FtsB
MGGAIANLRAAGGDRLAAIDWGHPVRRVFGQSRAVNWGVLFLVVVIGMLLVRPLVMSGMSWHRTAARIDERRAEVAQLEQRHDRLTARVEYYATPTFIAEKARAYGMVEPGEQSYVIREIVHPENTAEYAISRLRNATVDSPVTLAAH